MRIKKKYILWISIILLPVAVSGIALFILNNKQNEIITEILDNVNEGFKGTITIDDTKISPFKNFPYISIDLKGLHIYETKNTDIQPLANIGDAYIGFDLWTILKGKYDIKTIRISNAYFDIIQDTLNTYNILNAFESTTEEVPTGEAFHLDLKKIVLENVKLHKTNLNDSVSLHFEIGKASSTFKKNPTAIDFAIESDFILNIIRGADTSFTKNKHFELKSEFHFNSKTHVIDFEPSTIVLEQALFGMEGTIDFDNDFDLQLNFTGKKPNFDLLIAFAPNELSETLRGYGNKGEIYFDAAVKGKSINGHQPSVEASFGCKEGYFSNLNNQTKLHGMSFDAFFTNGENRSIETFEFRLNDFNAKPEAGTFTGKLMVKNFVSPEIDMQINSDFDLDFLAQFFNLKDLNNLTGNVFLSMNFHDIIDLNEPEKSLERLNQSYASNLKISNLNFRSNRFGLPIENLNLVANSSSNQLILEKCNFRSGKSDFSLQGALSNLPALVHQSEGIVVAEVQLNAAVLDLEEITNNLDDPKKIIAEKIQGLEADLKFSAKGNAFSTTSPLPECKINLRNFQGKFQHYEHEIKQLSASVAFLPDAIALEALHFKVANTDVSIAGKINDIKALMQDKKNGKTTIDYSIASNNLQFGDIFKYKGQSYIPESFKGHELHLLKMNGTLQILFEDDVIQSQYFTIRNFYGKLDRYPHAFHDFNAVMRLYQNDVYIDRFDGMIDQSDFHLKGKLENYGLFSVEDKEGNAKLSFDLASKSLRLKDLFSYNGENYVPEEYREESITDFSTKGHLDLHYQNNTLASQDLHINVLKGKFSMHPLHFENFTGNVHLENDVMHIRNLSGQLGKSDFKVSGYWHTNTENRKEKTTDKLSFYAKYLDMDALIHYEEPLPGEIVDHDDVFNLFEVPFRNLDLNLQIDNMNYHKYNLSKLIANIRMKENHYIYFDQLNLNAASGAIQMTGYLNGSDPKHIYFSPNMKIRSVNLDEVMYKLDNFGQDMLVSDNLHGTFSGNIKGKILMHTDLTPKLDESELEMQVLVEDGKLEKFEPMYALAEFFGDKNLSKIIFDKLENNLVMKNGALYLPNMVINSSLGFIELSGKQGLDLQMEYYMRIPLKMVTGAAMQKLFGRKSSEIDPDQEDEIIYKDPKKKVSYVNVKISGTPDDYKISLQKKKQLKQKNGKEENGIVAFEDLD
jgi:hypothetical protein